MLLFETKIIFAVSRSNNKNDNIKYYQKQFLKKPDTYDYGVLLN